MSRNRIRSLVDAIKKTAGKLPQCPACPRCVGLEPEDPLPAPCQRCGRPADYIRIVFDDGFYGELIKQRLQELQEDGHHEQQGFHS